jgi:hypothetical protein
MLYNGNSSAAGQLKPRVRKERAMRRMPIGIQTFDDIIEGGCAYAYKTVLVYELANGGKRFFPGRSLRFGRSLPVSTQDFFVSFAVLR